MASIPAGNYMFKVNYKNTRTRCEMCSKLAIKTPERHQWHCSGVFIVNFELISHLVLVFLLLSLNENFSIRQIRLQRNKTSQLKDKNFIPFRTLKWSLIHETNSQKSKIHLIIYFCSIWFNISRKYIPVTIACNL